MLLHVWSKKDPANPFMRLSGDDGCNIGHVEQEEPLNVERRPRQNWEITGRRLPLEQSTSFLAHFFACATSNCWGTHGPKDTLPTWMVSIQVSKSNRLNRGFGCICVKQPTNQNHSVLVFPIPSSTGPATMIYSSGVLFFFPWGSALAFFQLINLEKIVGQALFERDVGRRCGDVMTIAWTLWSYSMPEHVYSFSPGFREKSPKLLLVSTNGAICLDVASTSKGKWRFRLESPCRPQPKNGDVFLVLLETRFRNVCDAGRNASYAKCCDLVQCVKGNDCHEMSIPHLLVAFSAFFTLRGGEAAWK